MTRTIAIIGSGTSLAELPHSYRFPDTVDTMALNSATVAPQFYDMVNEKWNQSWTYAMFIDSAFGTKKYFPESYAFKVSLANPDGITYLLKNNFVVAQASNIRWLDKKVAGGSVLCPALLKAEELGYDRIILFGCDYCRRNDHRYWWETDPAILRHPRNNTLINAIPDQYEYKTSGSLQIHERRRPQTGYILLPQKAQNGETVYAENIYQKQMETSKAIMDRLTTEKGIAIFKWGEWGMLDIPSLPIDKIGLIT